MRAAFVLFFALIIGGCASTPDSSTNPLANTNWELRALVEGSDSLTTLPRDGLFFVDESTVSMRSCNSCNGSYSVDGSQLTTNRMMCTRRACESSRPELEQLVGQNSNFRIRGDWLIIENGPRRLYFAPGPGLGGD